MVIPFLLYAIIADSCLAGFTTTGSQNIKDEETVSQFIFDRRHLKTASGSDMKSCYLTLQATKGKIEMYYGGAGRILYICNTNMIMLHYNEEIYDSIRCKSFLPANGSMRQFDSEVVIMWFDNKHLNYYLKF